MENQEIHDKACKLLEEKGLSLGERMMVMSSFASAYKAEYPFISVKHEKGEVKYYSSDIEDIKNLAFDNEKEVILANAIYENIKDRFNPNEFMQMLRFTFRILMINSNWI